MTSLAWAAGIVEGEGCIGAYRHGKDRKTKNLVVVVSSNDRDVLERVQSVFRVGAIYKHSSHQKHHQWRVYRAADALKVIRLVLPYLSPRRQVQARQAVLAYQEGR